MARIQPEVKEINLKTNRIVFDNGLSYEMPSQIREMYENPNIQERYQSLIDEDRESIKNLEKYPLMGEVGAFTRGIGQSALGNFVKSYITSPAFSAYEAITPREGQQEKPFYERVGENLKSRRIAQNVSDQEIKEKYPFSYKFGELMGLGSDIGAAMTIPGGSIVEGAALGFGSSPPIYEDPIETLKGTAMGGAIGYGVGKIGEKLSNVASDRAAQREFEAARKVYPEQMQKARNEFRNLQREKLERSSAELKGGIHKSSLDNQGFIQRNLNLSEDAGSAATNAVEKFVTRLEGALPENLTTKEVVKIVDSLEGRIAKASREELPYFMEYKQHLVDRIPIGTAYNQVKERFSEEVINATRFGGKGLGNIIDNNVKNVITKMNPEEFYNSLVSGDLEGIIRNEIKEGYKKYYGDRFSGKSSEKAKYLRNVDQRADDFLEKNTNWLSDDLQQKALSANELAKYVHKKASSRIRNATGSPNPYMNIPPTNELILPNKPIKPEIGKMAEYFESTPYQPSQSLGNTANESLSIGLMGKVLGLPGKALSGMRALYGAGKAGGEGVMRFLTSPTKISEMTREVIVRGGLPILVESIANTYPSYEKGILLDTLDRQDAVAELENNPYIPLEQKAILQAKINRGRSIEELKDFERG